MSIRVSGDISPRMSSSDSGAIFQILVWVFTVVTAVLLIMSAFLGTTLFILAIVSAIVTVVCIILFASKSTSSTKTVTIIVPLAVLVIFGAAITIGSIEKVDSGEVGVVTTSPNSNMIGETLDTGWNFNPVYMTSNIEKIRFNTRTVEYVGSDSAEDTTGGITIKTSEGLDTNIDMSITFHLSKSDVSELRIQYGSDWMTTLIEQPMRSIPRTIGSDYSVEQIYGDKRSEFESKILNEIKTKVEGNGIIIEDLAIREVRLPDSVVDKINAKIAAEQEKQKAAVDKETKQTNAEAQLYVTQKEADASAYSIQKEAEGEAEAIKAKADAEAYQIEKEAEAQAEAYRVKVMSFYNGPVDSEGKATDQDKWDAAVNAYLTWMKFNDANVVVTDGNTVVVTP